MTGVAELAAGMFLGVNLRETLRLGDIFGMAANAKVYDVGPFRPETGGIVRVFGEGPVTGLAIDPGVDTASFGVGYIGVTALTGLVTSVGERMRSGLRQGVTPIVPVLAKAFREESAAQDNKENHAGEENRGHAKQMRDVFERNHRLAGLTR
jgi:hypothetical protein